MRSFDTLTGSRFSNAHQGKRESSDDSLFLFPDQELIEFERTLTPDGRAVNGRHKENCMAPDAGERWRDYSEPFQCFGPLLTINDIITENCQSGLQTYSGEEQSALTKFAGYAVNFLSLPNDQLGRAGNVCPYVPDAITNGLFRLTATLETQLGQVEAAMEKMTTVFSEMKPLEGKDTMLKTIVVVFPNVSAAASKDMIGGLQKKLKPSYIREGFMIGEFYPSCPEPGLHNESFRPLDTPVPALAVRFITKFDAPFMLGDPSYEAGYLERFGEEGSRRLERLKTAKAACPIHR